MKSVSVGDIYTWSIFNEEKQLDFNGHLLRRPEGNVLVDPVAMSDSDKRQLSELGGAKLCVVTNADHRRAVLALRQHCGFDIVCHRLDRDALELPVARTVEDGEEITKGLRAIHLRYGKTPGEIALWVADAQVVLVGDILRGTPMGQITLLPDAKLESPGPAALELRKLLALPFLHVLVGDGHSLFGSAREQVVSCLEERDDIELHHLSAASLAWQRTDSAGRYSHQVKHLSELVGARALAYNLRRLAPGESSGPSHYHQAEEEMFVLLEGACSLVTPRGRTPLAPLDFVACPPGERGTHSLVNDGAEPAVVLCLSNRLDYDHRQQTGLAGFRDDSALP